MKRVIITPIFNDGHMLPFWLDNTIEIFEPNLIIFNEGMYPCGQEDFGMGCYTEEYYKEFTHQESRPDIISFDIEHVYQCIVDARNKHPHVEIKINHIQHQVPEHLQWPDRLIHCVQTAITYGLPTMDSEDIVWVGELDMFLHPRDKDIIQEHFESISSGTGIMVAMKRFFISPFVKIIAHDDLDRVQGRGAKWGDGELWKTFMHTHHWGKYDDDWALITPYCYHYEWVRPGKYYTHKIAQIPNRADKIPGYHEATSYIEKHGEIKDGWEIGDGYLYNCPEEDHPIHIHGHSEYKRFHR